MRIYDQINVTQFVTHYLLFVNREIKFEILLQQIRLRMNLQHSEVNTFRPNAPFTYPLNTSGFPRISGGMEIEH